MVADVLRLQYCIQQERAGGAACAAALLSFVGCFALAWHLPGGIRGQLPSLLMVAPLALALFLRAFLRMRPYHRLHKEIWSADPEKWQRFAEAMGPVEQESLDGPYEAVEVQLRP